MIGSQYSASSPRSDEELAQMVINVAEATHVDGIICITESGLLAQHLCQRSGHFRVIATTTNNKTYDTLTKAGLEVIRLPFYTADKYASDPPCHRRRASVLQRFDWRPHRLCNRS